MFDEITFAEITVGFSWLIAFYTLFLFKRLPKILKVFGLWLIIIPLLIIYPEYLANHGQHNLFWKHVMCHFDLVFLSFFYYRLFAGNTKFKRLVIASFILYGAFSVYSTLTFETWAVYPATTSFISNCIFILYALLYYLQLYQEEKILYLEKDSYFLINSGVLIYYMSTLFIFLMLNQLTFNYSLSLFIFFDNIDCSVYILSRTIFSIALWKAAKRTLHPSSANSLI